MQSNHYLISRNKLDWEGGLLADALAIALLGLVDKEDLNAIKYFMKHGEPVNCAGVFIKLLQQ